MTTTIDSQAAMLSLETLEHAAALLRVLAHPHRLKLVELLLDERRPVGELAQALELAPNAVSQHLNQMKAHGILSAQRDGREVYYKVIDPHAKTLLACIRKHCVA